MQDQDVPYLFLTNNSAYTPLDVVVKLKKFGIETSAELVEHAHRLIAQGARLISTNSDTWRPTDSGPRPGCGALVALLEAATGRRAYHVGKPNAFMLRAARKRIGLRTEEVTVIGDTMETDIQGATESGFESVLVLTGSTTRETLQEYAFAPTRVVHSIADLVRNFSRGEPSNGYRSHRNIRLDSRNAPV